MDAVRIRVFKSWKSATSRPWDNTYDVIGPNGLAGVQSPVTAYDVIADAIVAAERAIHQTDVFFTRVVTSTWLPETGPYDPSRERSRPLASNGTVGPAADTVSTDLRIVLRVDRPALTGRPGRLFFRGVLVEPHYRARAGRIEWDVGMPDSLFNTNFAAFKSALAPYFGAGASPLRLSLISGTLHKQVVATTAGGLAHETIKRTYTAPYISRDVQDFIAIGPTIVEDDHAYYDRP